MADSYYGGAGAGGGGNEWELVSLTASTYAAAPGPVPVPVLPLHDAHDRTEQLTPPPPAAAIFMSQHFNLPAATGSCADLNDGGRQQQLTTPAVLDDEADDLDIPYQESETEQNDGLTRTSSDAHKSISKSNTADDVLIALPSESEEWQTTPLSPGFDTAQPDAASTESDHHIRSTSPSHHSVPAAATDGITTVVVGSASQPAAPAVPSGSGVPAANKVPSEAHAWWNKTFRFLQNNSRESLTFRFMSVAVGLAVLGQRDKLQLKLEFNVDTEKITCAAREPLGQVKLNMLVGGGRPVAHG